MSFWGVLWEILGRIIEARLEVWEEGEALCSVRMVVVCAMQELVRVLVIAVFGGWRIGTVY